MHRFFLALTALFFVAACENIDDISGKPAPIGAFSLGHNIVVAPNIVMGPASREADTDEWIAAVTKAVGDRFERYEGEQLYHFGISLEGYVLAQPGLPIVLSPKSVLILKLTVWDDAEGKKLNEEPEQITVLESLDGDTIVGSGLTKTAEEQMETLSFNAAKLIQRYIARQHAQKQWFKRKGGAAAPAAKAAAEDAAKPAADAAAVAATEQAAAATVAAAEEAATDAAKAAVN